MGNSSAIVAPKRRDLRKREIDENHPALDDVHAQVGVDPGDDQARRKRQREKAQHGGVDLHLGLSRAAGARRRLLAARRPAG